MKPDCIYCGSPNAETRDHIPPRGFFPDRCPSDVNLVTVPCCEVCRVKDQSNDEFIRNLFVSFKPVEKHPLVVSDLSRRRDRSIFRVPSQGAKLEEILRKVDVVSPGGIYLGQGFAFNLKDKRVDRFIERVSRAAVYDSRQQVYFEAQFGWVLNSPIPAEIIRRFPRTCKGRQVANVFSYISTPCSADGIYWVIMEFYDRILILSRLDMTTPAPLGG
jgi:hypothetical protein